MVELLRERGPSATWLCDHDNSKTRWLLARAGWQDSHHCETRSAYEFGGTHMCDLFLHVAHNSPPVLSDVGRSPVVRSAFSQLHVVGKQRTDLDIWLKARGLMGKPFVLVQPGNKRTMRRGSRQRGSNSKYWPETNWATLLCGLRERHREHAILMLGVPAEATLNDEVLQLAGIDNAYNIAHDLPLPRLMALAERAYGMISVDTGPAHLAAAVGCSVVVLFGKANPEVYAPRGPNARVTCLTGVHDGEQSMLGITPEQVLSAWADQHR
jgi:ADP-heptose:LPS heptosyltransferase